MSGIVLPGTRRKPVLEADERTRASRWPDAKIEAAVLKGLAAGPLMKWELREHLGINEAAIFAALQRLRDRKLVKWIGARRQSRWCLVSYVEAGAPKVHLFNGRRLNKFSITPKSTAPATSWWTTAASPEAFDAFSTAARERFAKPIESRNTVEGNRT